MPRTDRQEKRLRVVWWNDVPTPYMVERFNAIAELDQLEFEAWFSASASHIHEWGLDPTSWEFRYRILDGIGFGQKWVVFPGGLLSAQPPAVLVAFYSQPSMILGLRFARLRGIKTALWAQVTPDRWFQKAEWKERLKRSVFSGVDASFGSGEESRRFAMRYGVKPERSRILRHAVDAEFFSRATREARRFREASRTSFGLRGVTFLYVGRLWWGKGLTHLLEAFRDVQRAGVSASLVLVGDGPEEHALRQATERWHLKNVVFAGFRPRTELPRFFALSDVFVFPTLGDPYGLVVDEAMASSLPVIATTVAGEIRDRVQSGVTGWLVRPENTEDLTAAMKQAAAHPDMREAMGAECAKRMSSSHPKNWARDFVEQVTEIAGFPRTGSMPFQVRK